MAEVTSNIEFAHKIHEQSHHGGGAPHGKPWLELVEALVLAAVAVLTAWSGYQAAKWDARSAAGYAQATDTLVEAQEMATRDGQERLYDVSTFNTWITAKQHGDEKLAALFERRFRPEYAVAFKAWMKLDPFNNADAPAGPGLMPEFKSAKADQARKLHEDAGRQFRQGVKTREIGDDYVRITVVLATVLLLTALSQRFKIHAARVGLVVVAFVMLGFAVYWIATFPRA